MNAFDSKIYYPAKKIQEFSNHPVYSTPTPRLLCY